MLFIPNLLIANPANINIFKKDTFEPIFYKMVLHSFF